MPEDLKKVEAVSAEWQGPDYWSDALVELTGDDPVPDDTAALEDVAAAWVTWGRTAGYDVSPVKKLSNYFPVCVELLGL